MLPLRFAFALACGLAVSLVSITLKAKELQGVRAPAANACPTVEEARAKMTVPPGYEVRAFAAEPDVVNPVAMDFDARGRLWIAELYEYPTGSKTPSPFAQKVSDQNYRPVPPPAGQIPRDRIVILEDTDNDGRADKRTVFLEGLNLASGLCVADGGIYVGMTPHLLHFRDTDGDDRADQWKVVLTGFGRQDTHELINSFQIGPDGALFFTQGVFTTSHIRRPQDPETSAHKMDTGLGRVVIDRSRLSTEGPFGSFELFADGLSNSWGFDYDAAGNYFAEACVIDHLFHVAPGGVYQRQAGSPGNPYAYELLPSIVDYKHFRAAYAGLAVYQGGVYPADTDGHIFLGNIHANAIHEERVEPRGASFKAFPVRDFLKGNDGWFRPVQIRTGPDGFLWVMDWCDKYPCYQNAVANPEGVDRQRGRIWRVCHTGTEAGKKLTGQSRATKDLDLAKASTETLLNSLADSNNWTRRTARRLLVERMAEQPGKLIEALQAKVLESKNASERHESLWTLAGAQTGPKWSDYFCYRLATHEDPVVRGWFFRTWGRFDVSTFGLWMAAEKEKNDWVRSQMCSGLSRHPRIAEETEILYPLRRDIQRRENLDFRNISPWMPSDPMELYNNFYHACNAAGMVEFWSDSTDPLLNFQVWKLVEFACSSSDGNWYDATRGHFGQGSLSRLIARRVARRSVEFNLMKFDGFYWHAYFSVLKEGNLIATLEGFLEGPTPKRGSEEAGRLRSFYANLNIVLGYEGEHGSFKNEKDREYSRELSQKLYAKWFGVATAQQVQALNNPKTPLADRIATLRVLEESEPVELDRILPSLMAESSSEEWFSQCLSSLRKVGGGGSGQALIVLWLKASSSRKSLISQAIASRPDWSGALVELLDEKNELRSALNFTVKSSDLSPTFRRQLLQVLVQNKPDSQKRLLETPEDTTSQNFVFSDEPTRQKLIENESRSKKAAKEAGRPWKSYREIEQEAFYAEYRLREAQKLLGTFTETPEELRKLITAKRSAVLAGTPDLAKGKQTFEAMCAVCHEFQGVGKKAGPDLNGSGRANLDNLLHNLIAPNEVIGSGYENWRLTTKNGRAVTGRLVEKTDRHVRLLGAGGIEETIAAEQVEKLENTGESLMPTGFGQLPDDTLRDLVWYLLAPPSEGELTPEKKSKLAESSE